MGQQNVQEVQAIGEYVQSLPNALQGLVNATAGTSQFFTQDKCLNNLARDRIVGFKNTGNIDCTVNLYPYISYYGSAFSNVEVTLTVKAGGVQYVSNGQLNEISAPFDSLSVGVNYATLPSSGNLSVLVAEVIGN